MARTPASQTEMSLSQVILAPLNSLFKAQIHAGRSYLSYLLQMGYPHVNVKDDGSIDEKSMDANEPLYTQKFRFDRNTEKGKETFEISVPTLALIPVSPLAIDSAEFEFDFNVKSVDEHQQNQESEKKRIQKDQDAFNEKNRPWYLIKDPVSLRGTFDSGPKSGELSSSSSINIKVKVSKQPLPAGLDKLLTTLNQISEIKPIEKTNTNQ